MLQCSFNAHIGNYHLLKLILTIILSLEYVCINPPDVVFRWCWNCNPATHLNRVPNGASLSELEDSISEHIWNSSNRDYVKSEVCQR